MYKLLLRANEAIAHNVRLNCCRWDMSVKWTSKGHQPIPFVWKPKDCKHCEFEIGGSHVLRDKNLKVDCPQSVFIVDADEVKIYLTNLTILNMACATPNFTCGHIVASDC